MIIKRPQETRAINGSNKWVLVYGRRKTGKTFLVTNFIRYDEYFFVKSDKNILTKENSSISYEVFIEILRRLLADHKTIVVDEFHRLGSEFFDFLHSAKKEGKLILLSSTLFLSKRLISSNSPLLGIFAEIPVGILALGDSLGALQNAKISKKDRVELAILLREPLAIDYFIANKGAREIIATIILNSMKTIPALIGEIFVEEKREISIVYEGILRAISIGKVGSGEIASYIFSKKLIKKDDPSAISQYLKNMLTLGIIKRISVFNRKRFIYKLVSPLAKIYYYCDEKYNLSERKVTERELLDILGELMPRIVEDNIREFFAQKYGLSESVIKGRDFDIDGYLLKFKNPEIVLEVKWGKVSRKDIKFAEFNLKKIDVKRRILFVQDKKSVKSDLEVLDVDDLL